MEMSNDGHIVTVHNCPCYGQDHKILIYILKFSVKHETNENCCFVQPMKMIFCSTNEHDPFKEDRKTLNVVIYHKPWTGSDSA